MKSQVKVVFKYCRVRQSLSF